MRAFLFFLLSVLLINFPVFARGKKPELKEGLLDPSLPVLEITMIDVWQGDSIFLRLPGGQTVLVDAGDGRTEYTSYDAPEVNIIPFLKRNGIDRTNLDIFLATHPHHDHTGGAASIIEHYDIRTVYDSGMPYTTDSYLKFLNLVDSRDIEYIIPSTGDKLDWDPDVEITVLHNYEEGEENPNNNSIVLRLTYGLFSILLTGDAEKEVEMDILSLGLPVKSYFLKSGHHGSDTSSSEVFLEQVHPAVVLVSVGQYNKFGHPVPGIIERYKNYGCRVLRTDQSGDITVLTDGKHYQIITEKGEP